VPKCSISTCRRRSCCKLPSLDEPQHKAEWSLSLASALRVKRLLPYKKMQAHKCSRRSWPHLCQHLLQGCVHLRQLTLRQCHKLLVSCTRRASSPKRSTTAASSRWQAVYGTQGRQYAGSVHQCGRSYQLLRQTSCLKLVEQIRLV
jgi:hypothetical protein